MSAGKDFLRPYKKHTAASGDKPESRCFIISSGRKSQGSACGIHSCQIQGMFIGSCSLTVFKPPGEDTGTHNDNDHDSNHNIFHIVYLHFVHEKKPVRLRREI